MSIGRDHVDVTLIPLRPGVILVDPVKARSDNLPPQFASWDRIIVDEVMPVREYGLPYPLASNDGIGRNVLMLDPETVIVDEIQLPLMRALEKRRFTVVPLRYRHGRTLGGSWHCITLDTNRDGELVSYF
jgi:glycine amidinotransferase/scyllo-inosamine-4-phosphate amidinotransferase 1